MDTLTLAKYILPVEIVNNFDIVDIQLTGDELKIKLDEKLVRPPEHSDKPLESKGFLPSKKIHDFPIRDRAVVLEVRRRIWKDTFTEKTYSRSWELTAEGTSYSKEFAAFLKERIR
jgi:hypothetical protein